MYNLSKIAQFIENPSSIDANELESLSKLSEKHTYTPIFTILYLKALKKFKPLEFEKELKNHAFKVPSREQLFEIIEGKEEEQGQGQKQKENKKEEVVAQQNKELKEKEKEEEEVVAQQNKEQKDKKSENEEVIAKQGEKQKEEEEKKEKTVAQQSEVQSESEDVKVERPFEINVSEEEDIQNENRESEGSKNIDSLEREILTNAVGASLHLEIDELSKRDEEKSQKNEEEVEEDTESASTEENFAPTSSKNINVESDEKRLNEDDIEKDYSQSRTFTEWLQIGSEKTTENSFLEEQQEEEQQEKLDNKPQKTKNIEKFSAENKPHKDFFSATQKAKESLDYSKIPMTETLAKIYDAQGNFPRAIEAYQQLILKNPEKKVFFAIQIEKLKQKIDN